MNYQYNQSLHLTAIPLRFIAEGELKCYAVDEFYNTFKGEEMGKIFNGKKTAKLGTPKNPAVVNVKTKKRMKEVAKIFEKNGWKYTI